ncbi:MAG: AIR synthase family protein [Dehalococcoidia bacterium]
MTKRLSLGKLPAELLARLLDGLPTSDPRVLVGARPGVDAAAVTIGGRALIVTSDPITFPNDRAGWYAVNVNANDIAVMGGDPRWLVVTMLLPVGIEEAAVARIFDDLTRACVPLGVVLVGGHTEVTYGIDRPIISGTMLGEADPDGVITSAGMRPGDRIIVTGGIAIEGTSILAGEARDALRAAGVSEPVLRRAAGLLTEPGISVVRAARTLRDAVPVHAMHDATEGGLATALREMAEASAVGITIDAGSLPVLPETDAVCAALGLDPLGLLASGCLIAAVAAADVEEAMTALDAGRIDAWIAGGATDAGQGMWLVGPAHRRPWPAFDRDELARWLKQRPASR